MPSMMRLFPALAGLLGLGLLTGLVAYYGFPLVGQALASSGWGMVLVLCTRAAVLAGAGLGWAVLIWPRFRRAGICIGLRFIREAINCLLPVAQSAAISSARDC